jgi:hypothetical protein
MLERKTLKVFPYPTPPSEIESLVKVVGIIIQKKNSLSTLKEDFENNLLGRLGGEPFVKVQTRVMRFTFEILHKVADFQNHSFRGRMKEFIRGYR